MSRQPPVHAPGKASPPRPLRGLRYGAVGLLALVGAAVFYVLAERSRDAGGPPLASLDTGEGVSQRARRLDVTRTRRGLPSLKVAAGEAVTFRDGRTEMHDVSVTVFGKSDERTTISAPLAVSRERSSPGWSFRDGVVLENERGVRVEVPEIHYRESPPELSADGEVIFTTGSLAGRAKGLRYLVARRRLDFLSDVSLTSSPGQGGIVGTLTSASATLDASSELVTFRSYTTSGEGGQQLSGTSLSLHLEELEGRSRIRSLVSEDGFQAEFPSGEASGEALPPRVLTGRTLTLGLDPEGVVIGALAEGGVRLVEGRPEAEPRVLTSETLEAAFTQGRITSAIASGSARLQLPPRGPGGEAGVIEAALISARFSGGRGAMDRIEARTGVRATQGARTLSAPWLIHDPVQETWILRGEGDAAARLTTPEATVSAAEMTVDRRTETLLALRSVKSSYVEGQGTRGGEAAAPSGSAGLSALFGPGEGSLNAMADRLRLQLKEREAHYTGNVRVWKGAGSIEAQSVSFAEATGIVEARERVVARIPVPKPGASVPGTVTVSSSMLRYDTRKMEARFDGGAVATASGMRIETDFLQASGASQGGLSRMEASGEVRLRQGSIVGEGDRLNADFGSDTFVLYGDGRLAMIQDQSNQQVARGAVLTYTRSTGRIQVESESGGRTWITLRPTSERGAGSDPQSPR